MSCYLMMLRLNKSLIPWHNYPQPPANQARNRPHATLTRVGKGQSLVVGHSLPLSGQPNVRAYGKDLLGGRNGKSASLTSGKLNLL